MESWLCFYGHVNAFMIVPNRERIAEREIWQGKLFRGESDGDVTGILIGTITEKGAVAWGFVGGREMRETEEGTTVGLWTGGRRWSRGDAPGFGKCIGDGKRKDRRWGSCP